MKYFYLDSDIRVAYERFLLLKNDKEYIKDYKIILGLEKEIEKIKKQWFSPDAKRDQETLRRDLDLKNLRIRYLNKWNIKILVRPHWKIKLEHLLASKIFQPGDVKSKFLYAFFGGPLTNFVTSELKRKEEVSALTAARDERMKKMLCWTLIKRTKIRIRALARIFNVNNKTISNWYDQIEELSLNDRHLILNEIFSGKNMSIKKDALDTHPISLREDLEFSYLNSSNYNSSNKLD